MIKKDSQVKLRFFPEQTKWEMQKLLDGLITAMQEEKIKPQDALMALGWAGKDIHSLFWHVTATIERYRYYARAFGQFGHSIIVVNDTPQKRANIFGWLKRKGFQKVVKLDTTQVVDYTIEIDESVDDFAAFKVQRRNEMFGFTEANPSDDLATVHKT